MNDSQVFRKSEISQKIKSPLSPRPEMGSDGNLEIKSASISDKNNFKSI